MLYVYLKSGPTQEIAAASAGRVVQFDEGDVLECLDDDGNVVTTFAASEVLFYSRLPRQQAEAPRRPSHEARPRRPRRDLTESPAEASD